MGKLKHHTRLKNGAIVKNGASTKKRLSVELAEDIRQCEFIQKQSRMRPGVMQGAAGALVLLENQVMVLSALKYLVDRS
jgi:hypothetical protein